MSLTSYQTAPPRIAIYGRKSWSAHGGAGGGPLLATVRAEANASYDNGNDAL